MLLASLLPFDPNLARYQVRGVQECSTTLLPIN